VKSLAELVVTDDEVVGFAIPESVLYWIATVATSLVRVKTSASFASTPPVTGPCVRLTWARALAEAARMTRVSKAIRAPARTEIANGRAKLNTKEKALKAIRLDINYYATLCLDNLKCNQGTCYVQ